MGLKEQIFAASNGGIDILRQLFPYFHERNSFKYDETEKSESCQAKLKDQIWTVCCFDPERSPVQAYQNAIDWYCHFHNCDFVDALKLLAVEYGISNDVKAMMEIEIIDEKREYTKLRIVREKREVNEAEAKILGKYVTPIHCRELQVELVISYEYTNEKGETRLFKPAENNPHFFLGIEDKIYAPKATDSKFRYMATRSMPEAQTAVRNIDAIKKSWERINADRDDDKDVKKLPKVVIACGYRDALNILSAGYPVVWMSSEGLKFPSDKMKELEEWAENIFYCGDIDDTGIKVAHETCMRHLSVHRIYLPEELRNKHDHRGKPCKDVTDFLRHCGKTAFDILIANAAPYRFWYNQKTKTGNTNKISRTWLKMFIIANGFRRYMFDDSKGYVHIRGNVVKKVEQEDIKAWVNNWAQKRGFGRPILDMISGTRDLSETVLNELPEITLEFRNADHDHQLMVFDDQIWMITADNIKRLNQGSLSTYMWDHKIGLRESGQIIRPRMKSGEFKPELFKIRDGKDMPNMFFEITNANGKMDIDIKNMDCQWFRFLINTCRMHWKDEANAWAKENGHEGKPLGEIQKLFVKSVPLSITSQWLSDDQNAEQKTHLINRIYTMGYLMHRHKFRSKSWLVWCMDYKAESIADSKGRSGKSLIPQAFEHLKTFATENGRDYNLTKKNHIFADVTSLTDLLIINDCHSYLDLGFFFNYVTDNITVNPKNVAQRTIPFHAAGKMIVTSNFGPNHLDDSTQDRILFNLFGDWYHSEKDFGCDYRPSYDFEGNLFDDWDRLEWNRFLNFMAQCCMVYFNLPKCNPPMDQIIKRQNMRVAGDTFTEWANETLLPLVNAPMLKPSEGDDGGYGGLIHYDIHGGHIRRPEAMKQYLEYSSGKDKPTMNQFSKKVKAWAATIGVQVNPQHILGNSSDRNIKNILIDGKHKAVECIFLYSEKPGIEPYKGEGPIPTSDMPF